MNFFDNDNSKMHTTLKQIKSRVKAEKDIKASAIKMTSADTCTIQGSGASPYLVSLSSCTCPDFIKNKGKAPCKHIYRLASEIGVFKLPEIDPVAKTEMDNQVPEELAKWEKAFLAGQITADRYAGLLEAFSK